MKKMAVSVLLMLRRFTITNLPPLGRPPMNPRPLPCKICIWGPPAEEKASGSALLDLNVQRAECEMGRYTHLVEIPRLGEASSSCVLILCCARFSFSKLLKIPRAHLQKHERAYKCNIPGCRNRMGFARTDQLKRHKREVHQIRSGSLWASVEDIDPSEVESHTAYHL